MYNTDASILKQVSKLLQTILTKYYLTEKEKFTIADARTVIMRVVREEIEKKS